MSEYACVPMTREEAMAHDACVRCGHAAYWVRGEAKCGCGPFADDPGGPVKLARRPAVRTTSNPTKYKET